MIKESIQEEYIKIINIYAPNIGATQYKKTNTNRHKRRNRQNIIIVGDSNTPLTPKDRS